MAIQEHLDDAGLDDDSFGFLDMLAVIVEGLRPLLLVPLCAGALAFAWISFVKNSADFKSSAVISLNERTAEVSLSPANLSGVASQPTLTVPTSAIGVVTGEGPNVYTISVTMNQSDEAVVALDRILASLTAQEFDDHGLKRLEQDIEAKQRRLNSLEKLMQTLAVASKREAAQEKSSDDYVSIVHTIEELSRSMLDIEVSLSADRQQLATWKKPKLVERFQVVSQSGLPGARIVVTFVVLASGFAVLIVLFLRDLFQRAKTDQRNAAKVARIRQGLRRIGFVV